MATKGGATRKAAPPDVVYPYRRTTDDEALSYSLRSLDKHARGIYGRVWIVGDLPEWATGVEHIPHEHLRGRQDDIRAKWTLVAGHPEVSSVFLLMNDDMWLMRRVRRFEAFHMGPTSVYLDRLERDGDRYRTWRSHVRATADWMAEQGYPDPLVRQGHRPALFDKAKVAEVLDAYPADRPLELLGTYDLTGAGGVGVRAGNAKIVTSEHFHAKTAPDVLAVQPWLSASDEAFSDGLIGGYIRASFPTPSRYER